MINAKDTLLLLHHCQVDGELSSGRPTPRTVARMQRWAAPVYMPDSIPLCWLTRTERGQLYGKSRCSGAAKVCALEPASPVAEHTLTQWRIEKERGTLNQSLHRFFGAVGGAYFVLDIRNFAGFINHKVTANDAHIGFAIHRFLTPHPIGLCNGMIGINH